MVPAGKPGGFPGVHRTTLLNEAGHQRSYYLFWDALPS